jgi:hypothetical protein
LQVHPQTAQECEIAHQALTSAGHTHLIQTSASPDDGTL